MGKYFIYLGDTYSLRYTTKKGTVYRMFKDRPYLVKDEEDIAHFEAQFNFQEVSVDAVPIAPAGPLPAVTEDVEKKVWGKADLKNKLKSELIEVLTEMGETNIPVSNINKSDRILELQEPKGGEDMAEEETQAPSESESTETSEAPAEEKTEESVSSESSEETK